MMNDDPQQPCSDVIAVVGLGEIGRGIVACCLAHGFKVVGVDVEERNRNRMIAYISHAASDCQRAGMADAIDPQSWRDRLELVDDLAPISGACLVIEAISEDLSAKHELLTEAEQLIDSAIPIGSNTSAYPITSLQRGRRHPQRLFGMHWSSHGHVTRFMELTPGDLTSPQTMEFARAIAVRLGKEPAVLKKDIPGFICNRIAYAMYREAVNILESGVADADAIDRAFRNSVGLWAPMAGPLRFMDVAGGGAFYARCVEGVLPSLTGSTTLSATLRSFLDRDARGPKNNIGFYEYSEGDEAMWARRFTESILATTQYQDRCIPHEERDGGDIA